MIDRSHAPAWERRSGRSCVPRETAQTKGKSPPKTARRNRATENQTKLLNPNHRTKIDAGASKAAFPRWSLGTILKVGVRSSLQPTSCNEIFVFGDMLSPCNNAFPIPGL